MSELKLPRLLAAAKEFNIGQDTLVEFLAAKGFTRDELKPTAKLTEDMYFALQAGFQSDKAAKSKADQVEIPKSSSEKKRRDEEEITFKKEEPKAPEIKVQEIKEPVKEDSKPQEAEMPKPVVKQEEKPLEPEIIKIGAPEIEVPKIIDKIDLSAIDSSTRPKKIAKPKKVKKDEHGHKEEIQPANDKPAIEEITVQEESAEAVIENIKAEKLEGPKILGKIELPVDSDTRPKHSLDEKRKRIRIPIDKKGPATKDGKPTAQRHGGGFDRNHDNRGGRQQGQKPPDDKPKTSEPRIKVQKAGTAGNRQPGDRRPLTAAEREIDAKEIQEKIRQTQAKLAGGSGRGKSLKAKYRREKRAGHAEMAGEADDNNKLQVTEFVTVSELANFMNVNFTEVISKCMNLGIMVSINQRLDAEVIELVAGEFGFEVEFLSLEDSNEDMDGGDEDTPEDLKPRAPIVTIMGHVDHGKTSLLDYIRRANVVAGEAGGITQHIGAYEVTLENGRNITFLDTPGHEAFTAMRARGAKVTDIAIIVIAADDAVMPQTKEAISHAQAANVPMIFAINKIDRDGANPAKIYEQLAQMNILVESWGGKFQSQELSAKEGLNIDLLLEKILLEAELLDLKANPDREATGTIIEASLDKGRGYVATVLVQNGTLSQGDLMVCGPYYGRIKAMFNERNQKLTTAPPATPVVILGLSGAPQAGEKFKVYQEEAEAKDIATKRAQLMREQGLRARKHITLDEIGRRLALGNFKQLNLIIKGDVDGSVEALSDSLQKLSTEEIAISVVHKAVGQISESDVLLATASDAIIVAFNVRPSLQASKIAENEGVQIKQYSIIYNAIEEIKSAMEGMLEPKVEEREVATVEIREVYKFDKATVAGCYVTHGKIKRDSKIRLFRDGILIYPRTEGGFTELGSLKRFKDDVRDVATGFECGLTLKSYADINVGDTIVAFEEEEVKRTL